MTRARAARTRPGFTLVEILVSLLIFSIVSLAMVGILYTSTNLFKAGEAGRATTDEAVATLGVIDDDLRRMISGRDGGIFFSYLPPGGAAESGTGDCAVAFEIAQPNSMLIQGTQYGQNGQTTLVAGVGARLLVLYYVEPASMNPQLMNQPATAQIAPTEELLYRLQAPILSDLQQQGQWPSTVSFPNFVQPATDVQYIEQLLSNVSRAYYTGTASLLPGGGALVSQPTIIGRRALHFGVWISTEENPRAQWGNWTQDTTNALIPPSTTAPTYSTELDAAAPIPTTALPFPTAVLFTLSLSSGRFAPAGQVIADLGSTIQIGGIDALPVVPGAKVRINNEWIQYSGYANGILTLDATAPNNGRGALRSTQETPSHARGEPVRWGGMFSLGRIFPH